MTGSEIRDLIVETASDILKDKEVDPAVKVSALYMLISLLQVKGEGEAD